MPDCDWDKYEQIRGRELPSSFIFQGTAYKLEQCFKRDFYAATGLYVKSESNWAAGLPEKVVFKVYHTDSFGLIPLGWLGRRLADREIFYLEQTAGIPGMAKLIGRIGRTGFVREYIPGCHLREYRRAEKLSREFYTTLVSSVAALHARGISHNDLSKPENILVQPDGLPVIIDLQIATRFRSGLPGVMQIGNAILRYMQSVDRYHINKHRRHDRPEDFSPEELRRAKRKGLLLTLHAWVLRKPYRFVRHRVMRNFLMKRSKLT